MFGWAAAILLLLSLAAGWTVSGLFFQSKFYRALSAGTLGLGLSTSLFVLLSLILPPGGSLAVTIAATLAFLVYGLKGAHDGAAFRVPGKSLYFFICALAVAAWIFAVGSVQLFPHPDFLLWDLTRRAPGLSSPLMATASLFGPDPWLGVLLLCGLAQVFACAGAFATARLAVPDSKRAWALVGLYLLGSTESGWLVFQAPGQVLAHLWGAGCLLILFQNSNPKRVLALPMLGVLSLSSPLLALGLLLSPLRNKVALLVLLCGSVARHIYLESVSTGLLLAVVLLLYYLRKESKVSDATVSLCVLELVSPYHGLFGLTALSLEGGKFLERLWQESETGRWQLSQRGLSFPRRGFLVTVCLISVWFGIGPAESVFNDVILIGGQKEEVSYAKLARPHSLLSWLAWRGPRFGVTEADLTAISQMTDQSIYLSGSLPDPRTAALLAVCADVPFLGWEKHPEGATLPSRCALFLFTGVTETLRGLQASLVLVRGEAPVTVPGREFPGWEAEPRVVVRLEGRTGEPRAIDSIVRAEIEPGEPREVPAASLIPYRIRLHNPTDHVLDLGRYRGVQFAPTYPSREPEPPVEYPVAPLELAQLPPGESITVTAYLRTSVHPIDYRLALRLTLADGTYHPIPLEAPFEVRAWRVELPMDYPFKEQS